jgi:hypothetical protein
MKNFAMKTMAYIVNNFKKLEEGIVKLWASLD